MTSYYDGGVLAEDGRPGIAIFELDQDFNRVDEHYIDTTYLRANADDSDAFIDSEGKLVIATTEYDTSNIHETWYRPVVMKYDITDWTMEWFAYVGTDEYWYGNYPCEISAIVESHDKDGYLFAGDKYPDMERRTPSGLMMGKISNDGKELWRKYIIDDFAWDEVGLRSNDLVATSDGTYMFSATRSDKSDEDAYNSRVQTALIKFDDAGNFLFTSADEEVYNESKFVLFPNPAVDKIQIEHNLAELSSVSILDATGKEIYVSDKEVVNRNFSVDVSYFTSGLYFMIARDADAKVLASRKCFVNN